MTALYAKASKVADQKQVSILADGGISKSGDIVKALTLSMRLSAAVYSLAATKLRAELWKSTENFTNNTEAWVATRP